MRLTSYLSSSFGRSLFFPAHGRGKSLPKELNKILRNKPGFWDLPELPEFGGPLIDVGLVSESQKRSALECGVERCWYGVNGASGLLQAALLSMVSPGEAVLMPRNIHRSLIQACILGDIIPVLFDLPYLIDRGHYLPPDINWFGEILDQILNLNIKISGVVLVNPTYHGYSSDIKIIIERIHKLDLPVLVDEAHGAHLLSEINSEMPKSSIVYEADLVVHSLHKSSTGLAQTAVLWSQGKRITHLQIERNLLLFQTTSPSSLLLASCEASLRDIFSPSGKRRLSYLYIKAKRLSKYLIERNVPILDNSDPFRLVLHTAKYGLSGLDADKYFVEKNIIAELPEPGSLTFCLGFVDHKRLDKEFLSCWQSILTSMKKLDIHKRFSRPPLPLVSQPLMSCSKAWGLDSETIRLEDSVGRVCSEFICPYPPGIPLVLPGEVFDASRVEWLLEQKLLWTSQIPDMVRVVC